MCRTECDALDRSRATLVASPEAAAALVRWALDPEARAPEFDTSYRI